MRESAPENAKELILDDAWSMYAVIKKYQAEMFGNQQTVANLLVKDVLVQRCGFSLFFAALHVVLERGCAHRTYGSALCSTPPPAMLNRSAFPGFSTS